MTTRSPPFVETQTAVYDPYAQSWRFLGIVATCTDEDDDGTVSCPRHLLWAAYVDPDYRGNGVRAYQYHQQRTVNTDNGGNRVQQDDDVWLTTACAADKKHCAKLDCHEPNTRMQLLGIFKEPYYATEWFEQLFKHAGYCLWDSNTYGYMQYHYANWPEQVCTATGEYAMMDPEQDGVTTTTTTTALYLDLKPGTTLQYGLYTDAACRIEYLPSRGDNNSVNSDSITQQQQQQQQQADDAHQDHKLRIQRIAGNLGFVADPEPFHRALSIFQSCQLCRSYNLQADDYHCYDDADYRDVNQCMKFRTHTTMVPVNWKDLEAAHQQGVLDSVTIQGQLRMASNIDAAQGQAKQMHLAFGALAGTTVIALIVARWHHVVVRRRRRRPRHVHAATPPLLQRLGSF
jgi:hypothetical protein